jgi:hypothetical protein
VAERNPEASIASAPPSRHPAVLTTFHTNDNTKSLLPKQTIDDLVEPRADSESESESETRTGRARLVSARCHSQDSTVHSQRAATDHGETRRLLLDIRRAVFISHGGARCEFVQHQRKEAVSVSMSEHSPLRLNGGINGAAGGQRQAEPREEPRPVKCPLCNTVAPHSPAARVEDKCSHGARTIYGVEAECPVCWEKAQPVVRSTSAVECILESAFVRSFLISNDVAFSCFLSC